MNKSGQVKSAPISSKGKLRSKIIVIIIVILLILLSIYFLFYFNKEEKEYYTLEDIYMEWDPIDYRGFERKFDEGDIILFRDVITGKVLFNSTYGPLTGLCFYHWERPNLIFIGDRFDEFEIGDELTEELHMNYWYYNSIKYLWIDELILAEIISINNVIKGVSIVGGSDFNTDLKQSSDELILDINCFGSTFNYSLINISINQGSEMWISESNAPQEPYLDTMDPIQPGISTKGYLSYDDKNNDGNLSDDDEFIIRYLTPTKNERTVDSYMLIVSGMLFGAKYIINWYNGVFDFSFTPWKEMYSIQTDFEPEYYNHISEIIYYSNSKTVISIPEIEERDLELLEKIELGQDGALVVSCTYDPKTNTFSSSIGEIQITYDDKNANNILDLGDLFTINGTQGGEEYMLTFTYKNKYESLIKRWVAGTPPSNGWYTLITFNETIEYDNTTNVYNITIDSIIGRQDSYYYYFDYTIYQDDKEFLDFSLDYYSYNKYSFCYDNNGLDTKGLMYNDFDGNRCVTVGDSISVQSNSKGYTYKLIMYYYSDISGTIEWTT